MDIRLDKETFKALASGTRIDVLKLLGQRNHMQSEIASALELSVPTVKEHLAALEKAGLVERHDEGRKWKYYSLTKKGKGVLNPEEMKIWIVLAMLVFSIVGGIVTYFKTFVPVVGEEQVAMKALAAPRMMAAVEQAPVEQAVNYWPLAFKVAIVVFAIALIYLLFKNAQYKKNLCQRSSNTRAK